MAWSGRLGAAADSGLELSLGLPAYFSNPSGSDAVDEEPSDSSAFALQAAAAGSDGSKARARPAAAPVVGWPPVRSFRRNLASSRPPPQSSPSTHQDGRGQKKDGGGAFVKINMDGVPIGRKVDLAAYGGYAELSAAVGKLFRGLLAGTSLHPFPPSTNGRDDEEEVLVIGGAMDGGSGEYTLVYEDEEGDRVLVGDVPWEMFVATAKRLRVLKSSDLPASSVSGGFSFDMCCRNGMMEKKGFKAPGFLKTGTTIVGLVFADGVVLGADTRATEGPIVADKNCEKIHYMAPYIYCCGAGTAADTEAVTDMVSSQLQLHRYATGRESRVVTALALLKSHLFRYQGHVSAALVLGGVDCTGPHLHTREEGIQLVSEAICAGISNDLGSGSNVDVCVITKGKTEYLRNHLLPNPRTYVSSKGYSFVLGQTEVLATKITPLKQQAEVTVGDAMEE
ncbi:hypothetical protein PR202_ga23202 [Eleusine coracana subsp. coracana]|uniref:Auxin-responsive protein n=1 Tax=Eleusine coracana subsp. coracana TaxID=191504 RepID=A0AAV5D617_ELECO|nr:hypothetical protein PR202_ga23202 [Eleusine coracana subsp. coracana]